MDTCTPGTAPLQEPADILELPAPGVLLGVDLGTKRIGVAASDPAQTLASAVATIQRRKFREVAEELTALMETRRAVGLVVGLPVNMDGSEGPRAQASRAFVRNLLARRAMPIALWDERLSTAAVEREMIALDTSRARRAARIDAEAAAYILQGALDRRRMS